MLRPLDKRCNNIQEGNMSTTVMTRLTNAEVLDNLAKAKSAQKLDEALKWSHSEMVLEIPSFDAVARGKDQVRSLLIMFFKIFPDYKVALTNSWTSPDGRIAIYGEITATLTGDFKGHKPNGTCVTVPVFMLFGFRDEAVDYEMFLLDFGAMCRVAGVPLEAVVETIKGMWG
jgi:hypothetical protein